MSPNVSHCQVVLEALVVPRDLQDWKQCQLEALALLGLAHPGIPPYTDVFEETSATQPTVLYTVQVMLSGKQDDSNPTLQTFVVATACMKPAAQLQLHVSMHS